MGAGRLAESTSLQRKRSGDHSGCWSNTWREQHILPDRLVDHEHWHDCRCRNASLLQSHWRDNRQNDQSQSAPTVGSNASFGTAVPTLSLSAALRSPQLISGTQFPGDIRRIGGIEDASPDTIAAQRGATFRSNFGLIETTGQPVTVKVTVYYTYTSSLTSTLTGASTTFDLAPRQFMLVGLGSAIFGANRASAGDLHNITVEFEVTGGTGKVLPFISSVDNGSSDSTFRSE